MGKVQDEGVAWFAPDTNFFLQCKPASDVDWSQVTDATDIRLVVVRTVQREIDELKGGGNARRAGRARTASGLFKKVLQSKEAVIVLRDKGPKVSIELGPRLPADRQARPGLDLSLSDDQIVDQVLETASLLECTLHLLTGDAGPMQTARDLGLPFQAIPDEWALPPEPDPQAKRMAELERKVSLLSSQVPIIGLTLSQNGKVVSTIRGHVPYFAAPPDTLVERMVGKAVQTYPMANLGLVFGAALLRDEDIARYKRDYKTWVDKIRKVPFLVQEACNEYPDPVLVELHLDNTGAVSAEGIAVEISTGGPVRLVDADADGYAGRFDQIFPDPPDHPQQNLLGRSWHGGVLTPPFPTPLVDFFPRRRPREFEWTCDKPEEASERCVGECEEFRHAMDGHTVTLRIRPAPSADGAVSGVLKVKVSARNMPELVTMSIPVEIKRVRGDLEHIVWPEFRKKFGGDVQGE